MKTFNWKDLNKFLEVCAEGRTRTLVVQLLTGKTVNLRDFGNNPKRRYSRRSPSSFRRNSKRVLKDHTGVKIDGDIVSIPELQRPKSFLKDV